MSAPSTNKRSNARRRTRRRIGTRAPGRAGRLGAEWANSCIFAGIRATLRHHDRCSEDASHSACPRARGGRDRARGGAGPGGPGDRRRRQPRRARERPERPVEGRDRAAARRRGGRAAPRGRAPRLGARPQRRQAARGPAAPSTGRSSAALRSKRISAALLPALARLVRARRSAPTATCAAPAESPARLRDRLASRRWRSATCSAPRACRPPSSGSSATGATGPRCPSRRRATRSASRAARCVYVYFPGEGLQLHPLTTFKKANNIHGACERGEAGLRQGRACAGCSTRWSASPCSARAVHRLGVRLPLRRRHAALDQRHGGGDRRSRPTGAPASCSASPHYLDVAAQGARRLRDAAAARRAHRPASRGGVHYLQYSFAPRLYIFNAFLQSLIGLHDFGRIADDAAGERAVRGGRARGAQGDPAVATWATGRATPTAARRRRATTTSCCASSSPRCARAGSASSTASTPTATAATRSTRPS